MDKFVGISDVASNDPYKIRGYNRDAFDYIIDVGSNVGQFAMTAYFLFPEAKIFSYEPCSTTYKVLQNNMEGIPNVLLQNQAVGSGEPLYFRPSGGRSPTCTGNLFKEYDTGGYKVESITLDQVFSDNRIDLTKNILMKSDCEGGEQYILKDPYRDLLVACKQLSLEVHFQCPLDSRHGESFKDLPKWDRYNDWIEETFSESHSIFYHGSKKSGLGIYVITRLP